MNKYLKYLKYILEHKKNVFTECRKVKGMWWHGITHDLSKCLPSEFIPYARYFYGELNIEGEKPWWVKKDFEKAWEHHYKNNKHHWNYWIGKDMPNKYIIQMIIDWKAMARKFGDTAQEFYLKNYNKMDMTWETRIWTEYELGLNDSHVCNYGHTLKQFAGKYDEKTFNSCLGFIKKEYGIDVYNLLKESEINE